MNDAAPPLHRRLQFDLARGQVLDDTRRYVLLRADVLMGLFDGLPVRMRADALRALAGSVARHGADSVRAYAARPGTTPDALLATMADSAASLGWGAWRFERAPDGGALRLQVRNSPFAAQAGFDDMAACGAIAGMLEALGGALWGSPCRAVELRCAAQRGGHAHGQAQPQTNMEADVCTFELRPVGPAEAASAAEGGGLHPGAQPDTGAKP